MEINTYKAKTKKAPLKPKPRTRPLPKATEKYLDAEEELTNTLDVLGIKYIKKFQFKTTKHWRFDFLLVDYRILVEISGGPWSGGRKGKLKNKAWSLDRYDAAEEMGFTVVRLESSINYKVDEDGPVQIDSTSVVQWVKKLKRHIFNGTDQTIPAD